MWAKFCGANCEAANDGGHAWAESSSSQASWPGDKLNPLPQGLQVFERGWLSSNNVLLTDAHSSVLVDSGYATHQAQTQSLVSVALQGRPLDLLVNTHLHSDHCGGNAGLQSAYPDLQTMIPPGEAPAVLIWNEDALSYKPTGQFCPRFKFDKLLHPGQVLRMANLDWQILAAPGHDPHSVIIFQPSHKVLISADALWADGFGVVFPELEGKHAFDEVAKTLDLFEGLQAEWVIPGHGAIFQDVASALAAARRKLDGFMQNPEKHARYGAKVLLKFKLLELQRAPQASFVLWATQTHYFQVLHQRYGLGQPIKEWVEQLLADLQRSRALELVGHDVVNL